MVWLSIQAGQCTVYTTVGNVIGIQDGLCIGSYSTHGKCSPAPTLKSQWERGSAGRTHAQGQALPWGIRPALYLDCYETCSC